MNLVADRRAFTPEDLRRVEEIERLANGGGVERLIGMLDDPSWAVRRTVVAALAASGTKAVGFLCEALQHRRETEGRIAATVDALAAVSGDADSALAAMVADAEVPVLADIAQILGRRRTTTALSTVVALSRHADDNVAATAIEALGRIGGRAAVDSLVEAVQSGNFFRAFPAIEVLGRSGDPRAVAPLTALLEQPQYATEAVRALGRTGDVTAVAPLIRLFSRSSSSIARLLAVAVYELHQRYVERFGSGDAVTAELRAAAQASGAATRESGPAARGSGIVRQLILALTEGDPAEQAAICFVLGVVGDPAAAPALTALLDAPSPIAEVAANALRGMGPQVEQQILEGIRVGDSAHKRALLPFVSSAAATKDVVACLRDADADVKVLACEALGRMGAVAVVGEVFPLLADADPRVSYAAVAAIQSLGSRETDRLAVEAASSADVRVRRAALRILTYFGSPLALDVFLSALHDADERVREAAVQGLPFMDDPRAFDALIAAAKDGAERTRAAAMRSLGQCADDLRASAYLLKGLSDPDAWVRYYACQALGKLAFEPAAEAIIKLLGDAAGQVRVAAVEALSCLRGDVAAQALNAAAVDPDSDIQRAALVGLGVAQRAESLPLILSAVRSPDPATRLVAVSALAGFRTLAVLSAFRVAASDAEESVRTASIGFLAAMTGGPATRALIGLLGTTASTEQVLAALSLHVEGRIVGLLSGLEEADDETAPALTSALARMRRPDATAALIQTMAMRNVPARKAAASALAVLASKEALAVLKEASRHDTEPEVRQICSCSWPAEAPMPPLPMSPQVFSILSGLVAERAGLHFDPMHAAIFAEKVGSRAVEAGFESLLDYYYFLRYDAEGQPELDSLIETLVVGETYLFRELPPLETAIDDLIVPLVKLGRRPRIWCAACATGEEPHTIAMLLAARGILHDVDLVASDVNAASVRRARTGRFSRRALRAELPAFAERWVRVEEREVALDNGLTQAIDWRRINLMDDDAVAAVGEIDVIFCRNVLIYFSDDTVRAVIHRLSERLMPGGVLFVGISESLLRFGTSLRCEEQNGVFLYRKAP